MHQGTGEVATLCLSKQTPLTFDLDTDADVLHDVDEHAMVRHEAAEALGSVAEGGDAAVVQLLEQFSRDPVQAVAQSCEVALDMVHHADVFEFIPKS